MEQNQYFTKQKRQRIHLSNTLDKKWSNDKRR